MRASWDQDKLFSLARNFEKWVMEEKKKIKTAYESQKKWTE